MFKRAWELASSETAALLCAAETATGALDGVELGSPRSVSVAEALLCTELCGPRFATRVARDLGATFSDNHNAFTRLMQKAKTLRLNEYTERSVTAYLSAPMFGAAHPSLYKLSSPEALEEQAAAEAAAHMEELKRKAAGFGPFSGDSEAAAAIACAEAAAPGDPLRDAYLARRQLDELERRDQALFEARVREQSALDAAAEAEAREAEDLFVMQELELMVDGLPWAPDHPPCSGGIVDDVLQHVHGALPEDALDMSADLACVFEAPAGEVPAGEVHRWGTTATRCRSPVRDGRGGHPAQQRAARGSGQFSGCSARGSGPMATSMARGAQATVAWAVQHESGAGTERWARLVSATLGHGDRSAARFGTAACSSEGLGSRESGQMATSSGP